MAKQPLVDTSSMDILFDVDRLVKLGQVMLHWIIENVLAFQSLGQLLAIALISTVSLLLTRHAAGRGEIKQLTWKNRNLATMLSRIHMSRNEMTFLAFSIPFLWTAVLIAEAAMVPGGIIRGWASLVTAWGIIRISSSLIESRFWSTSIALVMWFIAALNILGWLAPTIQVLDKAAITMGNYHLSLLMMIKGVFIFVILLWLTGIFADQFEKALNRSQGLTPSQKVLFHKLLRITLIILVIMIGLNVIGIDLTALAVFGGAVGIGIGFGLQKIFGNLVSGFILLMDKSIKPGDVIAVGTTYGWVNRLGARYVSILTRDGKEHLIPNENLITERVENWSYSNDQVRIHIPLRVSYQSDIYKAKELMLLAIQGHPRILKFKHLAPTCLIMGFEESGVNFELRGWISDPSNGMSNVKSDIYYRIWDLFKENNIEIPLPQYDVHIRSHPSATPAA